MPCACPGANPAHIKPGTFYGTVQTAYDNALPGELIEVRKDAGTHTLNVHRDIYLRYSLGEDCNWDKTPGSATFNSPFTFAAGTFVLERGRMVVD